MPTPIPAPTAEQVVAVAEIMRVTTDESVVLVSAGNDQSISDAKWSATLTDIGIWNGMSGVDSNTMRIKKIGAIEFQNAADIDYGKLQMQISNRVRLRYGLSEITDSGSIGIIQSLEWF